MSENIFEEIKSLNDYYRTENFDDSDLQSRLYAKIYYENIEDESRMTDIPRTIQSDNTAPEINIDPISIQQRLEDKQSLESEAAEGKYNKAKEISKTPKEHCNQNISLSKGSSVAEPLVYDNTLHTQNSVDFHTSVEIQKLHSTSQIKSVQINRDKIFDKETISMIHECDNTNNDNSDLSMRERKENKKSFSKKCKSSNSTKNIHRKNSRDSPSKYDVLSKYEKQQILLAKQNKDKQISDSSDSEESILEVPIPPKPKPPLINLQDSDEDNNINLGRNEDLNSKGVRNCELEIIEILNDCQDISCEKKSTDKSQDDDTLTNSNINARIPTRALETRENIVLNCTTIQKGARSISEIQQLSKSAEVDQNQSISIEYTNQSSKKKSPQNKSKENNTDVQQNMSVLLSKRKPLNKTDKKSRNAYLEFVESIRSERYNAKRNVRYFNENQDNTLAETSSRWNNLAVDGKRQCDNEADRNLKQKRQCTIKQININNMPQGSNDGEKRSESFNDHLKPMSEEMRNYYCNSTRGQENFDISKLQQNMSKDPRMWAILDEDLMPCPSSKQRIGSRNVRCNNCQQDGHHRYNCSLPRRGQTCYICGMKGHNETRCPQKMCLTCGKQQNTLYKTCKYCRVLYCTMCNSIGHESTQCPDLWRRYHQTIDMNNTPQDPGNVMKPSNMLHCCNCTKRGHESSMCREFRWSRHFPTPAAVTNYTNGPMYMPDATSSSMSNFEMNMSPMTIDNVMSIPQKPKNMQIMGEYSGSFTNVGTLTSSMKTNRIQTSQEALEKEENLNSSMPEERQKRHRPNGVNEKKFFDIMYYFGKFHDKDNMDARMILKNLFTSNLTYHGRTFVKSLVKHETSLKPVFLKTLFDKAIKFEITIGITCQSNTNVMLQLIAMKDCTEQIYDLFIHWINLPDDEKNYGVDVTLPINCTKMFNLLSSKVPQLEKMQFTRYDEHIGGFNDGRDPRWLFNSIKHEKIKLEQHTGTRKQYYRLRTKLWRLQIKLLMIVNNEPTPNIYVCMFQNAMKNLREKRDWNTKLDAATYIKLTLLYNRLFVPHTPVGLFKTLRFMNKNEKMTGKNTNCLTQIHQESEKRMIHEQENFASNNNVNPTLLPPTSCTSQDTSQDTSQEIVKNPFSINIQHSSNDNTLVETKSVSDISSKINDTVDRNCDDIVIDDFVVRNSQIVPLNTESMSVQSEHSERNKDQLSTNDVNVKSDMLASKPNENKKHTTYLTKSQRKAMRKKENEKSKKLKSNACDRASELVKTARTFKLPYMTNAADELQRNINNQVLKPKHIQAMEKLIKLEKKYQKNLDIYCKNLKA